MMERLGLTLLYFLWQGACVAAIYAIARTWMRSAQARYGLACIALAAMIAAPLVTFAISGAATTSETKPASGVVAKVHRTAPLAKDPALDPIPIVETRSLPSEITPWFVRIWLTGAMLLWLRLLLTWIAADRMTIRQVQPAPPEWQRILGRLKVRIEIARPVKLLVSSLIQGPVVIGWLRPVVLIPVSALAGVPCEHLEALLAHELAHIRRHDYLINTLQSIAEATLFYHPGVWWISRHIRMERENCCDDVAVSVTGDPLVYVLALSGLESKRATRVAPALAASGGSLKHRIARLLGANSPAPVPGALVAVLVLLLTAWVVFSQTLPPPKFEAATIKEHVADGRQGVDFMTQPGRLHVVNNPVDNLIGNAYNNHKLVGAPEWIESDRYDLEATASGSPNREQMMQMLQVLLADRFKLRVHTEQREETV
ncbi:MAG TPA: M56 family metallopeptidase, partial [Bryobacteraceae bacterium]